MGILTTIGLILIGYYLFKVALRVFGPLLLSYAAKKTATHFKQKFDSHKENATAPMADEVILNKKKAKRNKSAEKVGEYIDFEEID